MVPPPVLVDFGSAAELAPGDHRDILVQSPLMQVLHQGADPLVKGGQIVPSPLEIAAVPIPEAEADGNATNPGLHQPAGQEELSHQSGGGIPLMLRGSLSIALADSWIFLLQVQGFQEAAGGQNIEGLLVKRNFIKQKPS